MLGQLISQLAKEMRKLWLHTDNDSQGMYEKHQGKKSIQLWCYTHAATKPQSKDTPTSSSTGAQKSSEVDEIYEQLKAKHKENRMFDEERL